MRYKTLGRITARWIQRDMPSYERAMARYLGYDRRFVQDGPERAHFLRTLERVAARLRAAPCWAERALALDEGERALLAETTRALATAAPRDEETFHAAGLMPELVPLLGQLLGVFREDYLAFVEQLPGEDGYRPRYINIGPSGLCNLRCPSCILWGALFQAPPEQGLDHETLARHLADAEALGDDVGLSLCIGEPTANLRLLDAVLDRIRVSPALAVRSFVTNGLFAATVERAQRVWQRVLAHLGPDKARRCYFAVSANPELVAQGVSLDNAVNALDAYRRVMPGDLMIIQLIRGEASDSLRGALLARMAERGLIDAEARENPHGRLVPLRDGGRVAFTVMAKMPAVNSPGAEDDFDPDVFYLDAEALARTPFPGLFDPLDGSAPAGDGAGDGASITLGPDGLFYVDYHFMVRGVRPLGATLPEAIEAFGRDPILTRLRRRGGLNEVLEAWLRLPARERPIPDLRPAVGRYATISMAAANVIFGDEDVALRLARQLTAEMGRRPCG